MEIQLDTVFLLEFVGKCFRFIILDIRIPYAHDLQVIDTIFLDGSGSTKAGTINGVNRDVQIGILQGFDQQRRSLPQLASENGIGTGGFDLGGIAGKILDLAEWMQVIANDLDVGATVRDDAFGCCRCLLSESVVLVDQIDRFDVLVLDQLTGDRFDFHVDVRIEAKMPEIALGIGQVVVDA